MTKCWRPLTGFTFLLAAVAFFGVPQSALAVPPVPKVVPWTPGSPAPHDTYLGNTTILEGTADRQVNLTFDWDPGDGGAHCTGNVTNQYDVECSHAYVGAVGTTWTAVLKLTDTGTLETASVNYPVRMADDILNTHVNVAIDEGLWFLHRTMQRYLAGAIPEGDWDNLAPNSCPVNPGCDNVNNSSAINAANIQAFEVNSHLEIGPATDPYTEDMSRALKRMFSQLTQVAIPNTKTINFAAPPSCPVAPCTYNPDSNGNGIGVNAVTGSNNPIYQGGQFIDAIVATGTPGTPTTTGGAGVLGRTYKDIVQDMVDYYSYCQYPNSPGGSWRYGCQDFVDNSSAQWAAIGLIAANRSFAITIPAILTDANKVALANMQQVNGIFGYTNSSPLWGPFATTPSGMVQMSMDGIGRGNTMWDHAESFIRDNFDNPNPDTDPGGNMKAYTYGLFSFTKSMLLHSPGGVLTPITLLHTTSGSGKPDIDWYAAVNGVNGATSNGVAKTLTDRQSADGSWYNHSYVSNHYPFETAWSIIMLRRTVFVACVSDLTGKGTPSGRAVARIDLTWSPLVGADHYLVLRGTTPGGPYSPVGTALLPAFSDTNGLANNGTYDYVLQPINAAGGEICQSNEAQIHIAAAGR
jgi:hypothetical protein